MELHIGKRFNYYLTLDAEILLSFLASINLISESFVRLSSDRTFLTLFSSISEKNKSVSFLYSKGGQITFVGSLRKAPDNTAVIV